jgi:hypothetical protein
MRNKKCDEAGCDMPAEWNYISWESERGSPLPTRTGAVSLCEYHAGLRAGDTVSDVIASLKKIVEGENC